MSDQQKAARRIALECEEIGGTIYEAQERIQSLREGADSIGCGGFVVRINLLLNDAANLVGDLEQHAADMEDTA